MERLLQKYPKNKTPAKVLSEEDKVSAILRDNFNQDFVSIICDDEQMVNDMKITLKLLLQKRKTLYNFMILTFHFWNITM